MLASARRVPSGSAANMSRSPYIWIEIWPFESASTRAGQEPSASAAAPVAVAPSNVRRSSLRSLMVKLLRSVGLSQDDLVAAGQAGRVRVLGNEHGRDVVDGRIVAAGAGRDRAGAAGRGRQGVAVRVMAEDVGDR